MKLYVLGGTNIYVSVKFETSRRIVCTFLGDQSNGDNVSRQSCVIMYGPCEERLIMTTHGIRLSASNTIIIDLPAESPSNYCYIISASNGTFSIRIEGMSSK